MQACTRNIRVRLYDGTDTMSMPTNEQMSVEEAIRSWAESLQVPTQDANGHLVDWTLQDARGNAVPPSASVEMLDPEETYSFAPDMTPA